MSRNGPVSAENDASKVGPQKYENIEKKNLGFDFSTSRGDSHYDAASDRRYSIGSVNMIASKAKF